MKKWKRQFTHCFAAKGYFFSNSRKIIPTKEMRSVALIKSACQTLTAKIKAFQSAFEVKDLAANGTCRQVDLLT